MIPRFTKHFLVAVWCAAMSCQAPSDAAQRANEPPPFAGKRPSREEAAARFATLGPQPGQRLPPLSLVDLDGRAVDLATVQGGRPLVLVTCSLTCNIARQQQAAVTAMREQHGERAAFVMIYTIDAHPKGDPCPYTGEEWVPPPNERDGVLVRQPADLQARLVLARRYANDLAAGTTVLVDTMDDASWRALGEAPHVGICVDARGIVVARTGWFDPRAIEAALAREIGG